MTRSRMKKALLLSGVICWVLPAWGGGEIGNARYVDYANLIGDFKTKYPQVWETIDLGPSVSFVETGVDLRQASTVNVNSVVADEVVNSYELYYYVAIRNPGLTLEAIRHNGRRGYVLRRGEFTHVYILREPGVVLHVQYRVGSSDDARSDVNTILGHLTF